MGKNLRVAMAQINCVVGDVDGNSRKVIEYINKAKEVGADIIAFPELSVTGYPPEDLLLKDKFVDDNLDGLKKIVKAADDIVVIVGFADKNENLLYNAAGVIYKGAIKGIYHKVFLPNYGVFDEKRYFESGNRPLIFKLGKFVFGVNICEDIWHKSGPTKLQAAKGAGLIININSSPYHVGKIKEREEVVKNAAKTNDIVIAYINLVGGQDELVFDGQSMLVDNSGKIVQRAEAFKEDLLIADVPIPIKKLCDPKEYIVINEDYRPKDTGLELTRREIKPPEMITEVYEALVLGLKDYVLKNGFEKAVVGLSGGIDSSLVAALAVDAISSDNVIGVFMPTRYSSEESEADAKSVAANLGMKFINISIDHIFKIYLLALEQQFAGRGRDTTEENLQARIRGNIMMALSNKFGWLVLTTGNKSEMSTGYATLYGDMAGGLAVIKDVPKTLVYKLARYRNNIGKVIPERVLTKEPTAELKADQKDKDTLPPYDVLDPILKAYIEEDEELKDIVSLGYDKETVSRVLNMVDRSEYKRRQSPPGIKITPKAFGKDRRMPITNKYR